LGEDEVVKRKRFDESARMYLLLNVSFDGANAIVGVFELAVNSPKAPTKSPSSSGRG